MFRKLFFILMLISVIVLPNTIRAAIYDEVITHYSNGNPLNKYTISADKASALANGNDAISISMGFYYSPGGVGDWTPGLSTTFYPQVSGDGNKYPGSVRMESHVTPVTFQLTSTQAGSKTITYSYDAMGGRANSNISIEVTFTAPETEQNQEEEQETTVAEPQKPSAPTVSNINSQTLEADKTIKNAFTVGEKIILVGKATVDSTVKLYIYSEPTTAEAKSDKDGNWTYTIASLPVGEHRVEAEVTDSSGNKSDKEEIAKFKVKAKPVAATTEVEKTPRFVFGTTFYILGGILLVLIGVLVFVDIKRRKMGLPLWPWKKKNETGIS